MQNKIYTFSNRPTKDAINIPLLDIKYIKYDIDYDKYDLFIFTSQNAVLSIKNDLHILKNKNILAIGSATKNILLKNNLQKVYMAKESGSLNMIKEFDNIINASQTMYVRAKDVAVDIKKILKQSNNKVIDECITYKTICKQPNKILEKNSWVILTSPKILSCFIKHFDIKHYKILLNSSKLSKHLPSNTKYYISKSVLLDDCVNYIKTLKL